MRTHSNSFWKASDSRVTHSQTAQVSLSTVKSQCWDVVNEFRSIVCDLLLEREVKRKKIKKLVDSMSSSLMEMFDSHTHMREISFALDKNDFNSLRFVTEEATAPLK